MTHTGPDHSGGTTGLGCNKEECGTNASTAAELSTSMHLDDLIAARSIVAVDPLKSGCFRHRFETW